jgi:hypothetical protein
MYTNKYLLLALACGILSFFMPLILVIVLFVIGLISIKNGKMFKLFWASLFIVFLLVFGTLFYNYIITSPSKEDEIRFEHVRDSLIEAEKNRHTDSLSNKLHSDTFTNIQNP